MLCIFYKHFKTPESHFNNIEQKQKEQKQRNATQDSPIYSHLVLRKVIIVSERWSCSGAFGWLIICLFQGFNCIKVMAYPQSDGN